jgi:hypothetical protein
MSIVLQRLRVSDACKVVLPTTAESSFDEQAGIPSPTVLLFVGACPRPYAHLSMHTWRGTEENLSAS